MIEAVKLIPQHIKDDTIRVTHIDHLKAMVKQFDETLEDVFDRRTAGKLLEEWELATYLKFLKCPYLEKRINGLTLIVGMLTKARAKDA
jgi:hypothetical protein